LSFASIRYVDHDPVTASCNGAALPWMLRLADDVLRCPDYGAITDQVDQRDFTTRRLIQLGGG
jgi:hypothetical protein